MRDGSDKGRVKFRFVEFEVEGGTAAIQEGLRNIAAAIARTNSEPARALPSNVPTAKSVNAKKAASNGTLVTEELPFDVPPGEGVVDAESASEVREELDDSAERGTRSRRTYKTPDVLTDVDLNAGPVPFRDFVAQKSPTTDNDRYLVIAVWFKDFRKVDAITPGHVYTCYRFMNWSSQKDVSQPFRKMKGQGLFTRDSSGAYVVNHIGIDQVSRMPKAVA